MDVGEAAFFVQGLPVEGVPPGACSAVTFVPLGMKVTWWKVTCGVVDSLVTQLQAAHLHDCVLSFLTD